jgi:aconitase B
VFTPCCVIPYFDPLSTCRNRDELKDLACLGFTADLVMQSFCHTAAYPKVIYPTVFA